MNRAGCCCFSGKGLSAGGGIQPLYSGRAEKNQWLFSLRYYVLLLQQGLVEEYSNEINHSGGASFLKYKRQWQLPSFAISSS
jgi:hypothetical protein